MTMWEKKIVARVIDIQKENWEKFTTHFSEISSNLDEKCHVLLLIISISEKRGCPQLSFWISRVLASMFEGALGAYLI